jgi:hypothetical protein
MFEHSTRALNHSGASGSVHHLIPLRSQRTNRSHANQRRPHPNDWLFFSILDEANFVVGRSNPKHLRIARFQLFARRLHGDRIGLQHLHFRHRLLSGARLHLVVERAVGEFVDQHLLGFAAEEKALEQPCRSQVCPRVDYGSSPTSILCFASSVALSESARAASSSCLLAYTSLRPR